MSALTRFKGERCGVDNCRSRRYHRADDGLVYCQNGHQSTNATFEVEVEDNFGISLPTSDAAPRVRRASSEADPLTRFFNPRDAAEAFLQCFQIALQKQSRWIVENTDLPAELEIATRDLWLMRVRLLEGAILQAAGERSLSQTFDSASSDGRESARPSDEPRLARALKLRDCPSLLYLACVVLQLPVTLQDVHEWLGRESFPYLRIASLLPDALYKKLPLPYRIKFARFGRLPLEGDLHRSTLRLASLLHKHPLLSLRLPPLNHRLVLFRFLTELSLPLDIYTAVLKLGSRLQCHFKLLPSEHYRTYLVDHPELQLLSLLIVAVKLIHPFDGKTRRPRHDLDASNLQVDWHAWASERKDKPPSNSEESRNHLRTRDTDVFGMTDAEIDGYLGWFQRNMLNDAHPEKTAGKDLRDVVAPMLPLDEPGPEPTDDTLDENRRAVVCENIKHAQSSLRYVRPVSDEQAKGRKNLLRPGDAYEIYRRPSDLPLLARPFFKQAARVGAVDVGQLVLGVYQTEMRLRRSVMDKSTDSMDLDV